MNIFRSFGKFSTFPLEQLHRLRKMAQISMDTLKANALVTKETISALKTELQTLSEDYNILRARQLREENAKLLAAVEQAKNRLVQAEIANGVPQIPIPNQKVSCASTKIAETVPPQAQDNLQQEKQEKPSKPKADKAEKPKKEKKTKEEPAELPIDIGRLDLRIAKILEVQRHPDADTLYLLTINCGEDKPRTVCSGLVKHIALEDLQDRSVMLLCNLKPAKMRGIMSEAMVMCASTADKVEVLSPPENSQPGDLVDCEGYTRQPDAVMNPKKKIFETVAPDLHTNDKLECCYKGVPLKVVSKGEIKSQTLKNVPVK